MKNIFKNLTCLILIFTIILCPISHIYADEVNYDNLDTNIEFFKAVSEFVNTYYQYDIPQEEVIHALYQGFFDLLYDKSDKEANLDIDNFNLQVEILKRTIKNSLVDANISINEEEITKCLYKSLFNVLDKYSEYFTKDEYEQFSSTIAGEFGGIGVSISYKNSNVVVNYALPNSPSLKAGILPNDIIISVDEKNVEGLGLNDVTNLIKGNIGTSVNIGILRNGQKLNFDLTRELVEVSSVEAKIVNDNLGYIHILEFNENTTEQLKAQLETFDKSDIKKIILDVRNNPGGSLQTVLDILNLFVAKGPLLYVDYSTEGEICYSSNLETPKYEVCVLVNQNSASASEIFAGAIQDRNVGKIIGTTTYGKGVVQSLFALKNEAAIKLTTAEYFTPNKNKVQGIGITPDIYVELKSNIDFSNYPKLKKERKAKLDDIGLDVLGSEMILETLGYNVNKPDGVFDKTTFDAIKEFQKNNNLYAYGVLDYSTQDCLTNSLIAFSQNNEIDTQLAKAIEIMK
ncbi:S41 family peptidase [Sedimentibacter sp. zth1]|uniref:S41 family peptidase n=1 Tax=Sedimentibacter sp. zth1 TaxID=2816908 RepID=UPI001A914F86|nr:S41 family peptidase [Sedimentibacter sp. zth1]QSX04975.1 S41 family peptidase [Sedimentibacter sp. zth1]